MDRREIFTIMVGVVVVGCALVALGLWFYRFALPIFKVYVTRRRWRRSERRRY